MPLTENTRNALLDGSLSLEGTLWLQLHDGDPGTLGGANQIALPRRAFTRTPAAAGVASNVEGLVFDPVAAEARISHWSAFTASAGGVARWTGEFAASRLYRTGDAPTIAPNALILRLVPPGV